MFIECVINNYYVVEIYETCSSNSDPNILYLVIFERSPRLNVSQTALRLVVD